MEAIMSRSIEQIEAELAAAREELSRAEGTPSEVYSRIVGYYRSVRNWNRGKKEEFAERRLYSADSFRNTAHFAVRGPASGADGASRILLFVRDSCPACPGAKAAAARLGIPVELVDADQAAGRETAERMQVLSTPTAVLFSADGRELGRARDARSIAAFASGGLPAAASM